MAYSARLLSTNALQKQINQAHTFVVGDVVRLSAGVYVKAQADSEAHAAVCGMVSYVASANVFFLCQVGYVSNISVAKVANNLYYLDPVTAGALINVKPVAVGQVELPCFIADSATTGYFFTSVGDLIIASGSLFPYTVVTINTNVTVNNGYITNSAGLLTMTLPGAFAVGDRICISGHGAGGWTIAQPAGVQIFDLAGNSTIGGSVSSSGNGDVIDMVCVVANTSFRVVSSKGTLSYV